MDLDKHDLVRNTVPGFVFAIVVFSFYAVTGNLERINENQKAIVLFIAGYPLGFLLYAAYRILFHVKYAQAKLEEEDAGIIRAALGTNLSCYIEQQ